MKNRPFLELFNLFLLVALFIANAWDFIFRADHSVSSLLVSLLVVMVVVVGYVNALKKKPE
jgi:hypothetical protein